MACYSEYHTDPGHNGCGTMEEHLGPNWRYDIERGNRYAAVNEAWRRFMDEVNTWMAHNPDTRSEDYEATALFARGERFRRWFRTYKAWR